MKLRKFVAAFAAAAIAVSATVASASAKEVWSGSTDVGTSWSSFVEVPGLTPSEGQILTVDFSVNAGQEGQLIVKDKTDGWPALEAHKNTTHAGYNGDVIVLSPDETSVSYVLTANDAENIKNTALLVAGSGITIKSVDISDPAPVVTPAPVEDTSASASIGGTVNTALYVGNSSNWLTVGSDIQKVSTTGEYTYKVDGLSFDSSKLTVIYVKDADVEAQTATTTNIDSDVQVLTKSIKINGKAVSLTDGYKTGLNDDGYLDIAWYNIWAENFISVDGIGTINSVEVTVEFVSPSAAAPAEPEVEEPVVDEPVVDEPVDEEPVDEEPVDEEPVDDEPVDDVPDDEPVDDEETEEPDEDSGEIYGDVYFVDATDYFDGSTLFVRDEDNGGFADDFGIALSDIYGINFYVTFDDAELADDAVWVGGGLGANSDSTGWEAHEWGKASGEKEITPDFENGIITWYNDGSVFTDDESYAQLWIQTWGGTVTVDAVELIVAAESEEDPADADADAAEENTDDAAADKGNPDTGVAGVAVAAGIVALAGAAVVVSRKRK